MSEMEETCALFNHIASDMKVPSLGFYTCVAFLHCC